MTTETQPLLRVPPCCWRIDMSVASADPSFMRQGRRRVFVGMALVGPVIGLMVAGLMTRFLPDIHEGAVSVEVHPENPDDLLVSRRPEGVAPEEYVEPWILKEIGSITNRDSLDRVIETLDLDRRWRLDRDSARAFLERKLAVGSVRGTALVFIRVRLPDETDAGRIVRELALGYQERRWEIGRAASEQMVGKLKAAIQDQEQEVERCRAALAEIERTMLKNLYLDGTTTLLHIPESPEHVEACHALAAAEKLLRALRFQRMDTEDAGEMSALRRKMLDPLELSIRQVSPNVPLNLTIGAVLGLLLSPLPAVAVIRIWGR